MPTGYTSIIEDNPDATFADYLWRCARAFGPCVAQREDGFDVPVRMDSEPWDYHLKALGTATEKLAALHAMPLEAAEVARQAEVERDTTYESGSTAKATELTATYKAMLAHVKAWVPPTSDHEGLKTFMREQIEMCVPKPYRRTAPAAASETAEEWLTRRRQTATEDVEYHSKEWREERERTAERNHWKRQLAASVPQPAPKETPQ